MGGKAKIDSPNVKKLFEERKFSPNLKERRRTLLFQASPNGEGQADSECLSAVLKMTKVQCLDQKVTEMEIYSGTKNSPLKNLGQSFKMPSQCSPFKLRSPQKTQLSANSKNESNNRMRMLEQRLLESASKADNDLSDDLTENGDEKESEVTNFESNLDVKNELSLKMAPSSPKKMNRQIIISQALCST